MAGVASDSLGALACDEVYVHARKQQGRHKARNVEEGLQQGVEALGRALAGGFTGEYVKHQQAPEARPAAELLPIWKASLKLKCQVLV